MSISAAATAVGLPTQTVRYYADIGLFEAPARVASGYRTYDGSSARKLAFVRRAKEFGFTIEECRELLGLYQDEHRDSAEVKAIASRRLKEIRIKRRELQNLNDELARLLVACNGDHLPDCPIIDCLDDPK